MLGGLAHLVEHMVFKGAGGRGTRELAEAIEDVGGYLNAWTSRDQTAFHGRVLAPRHRRWLAELIADLVRAPHFDEAHLEREKEVILSELGECHRCARRPRPRPSVRGGVRRPAARPIRCSAARRASAAITRDDCLAWLSGEFVPSRPDPRGERQGRSRATSLKLAERLFGDMDDAPGTPIGSRRIHRRHAQRPPRVRAGALVPGPARACRAPIRRMPALALFVQALGGGTSSRLFQELREERGLAYSICAWSQAFADTGLVDDQLRGGQGARGRIDEPRPRTCSPRRSRR